MPDLLERRPEYRELHHPFRGRGEVEGVGGDDGEAETEVPL